MWRDPRLLRHARPLDRGRLTRYELGLSAVVGTVLVVALVMGLGALFGDAAQASLAIGAFVAMLLWLGLRAFPDRSLLAAAWRGIPPGRATLLSPGYRRHLERHSAEYALLLIILWTFVALVLVTETPRHRPLLDAAMLAFAVAVAADLIMKRWPQLRRIVPPAAVIGAAIAAGAIAG